MLFLALALLSGSMPQADPGVAAFQRCAICHSINGSDDTQGPDLRQIYGRRIGADAGFPYSRGMQAAGRTGRVWNEAELTRFLTDPEASVPGTAMPAPGGSVADRRVIIDYLKRLSPGR